MRNGHRRRRQRREIERKDLLQLKPTFAGAVRQISTENLHPLSAPTGLFLLPLSAQLYFSESRVRNGAAAKENHRLLGALVSNMKEKQEHGWRAEFVCGQRHPRQPPPPPPLGCRGGSSSTQRPS